MIAQRYALLIAYDDLKRKKRGQKEKKGSVLTIDTLEEVRLNAAMARQLRIQYDGAIYHLLSRGDRREEIFRDDVDRKSFVETLGVACEKTDWHVHAYC